MTKTLKNNLQLEGVLAKKESRLQEMLEGNKLSLANRLNSIVRVLNETKQFTDKHDDSLVTIGDTRDDIVFVLLNSQYICPLYTSAQYCSLNPLLLNQKTNELFLSTGSVGCSVEGYNIDKYITNPVAAHSLEEIDLETFDAYEYLGIEK